MLSSASDDQPTLPKRLTLLIQCLLAIGLAIFIWRRDWENAFLTVLGIGLTLLPTLLKRRFSIDLPPDFQFVATLFVHLTLFLGSAVDLYYHYWWWDIVLHAGSGFLFGIVGFLAVFLLNEVDHIPRSMKPKFVCMFAVTFSVFIGVNWEICEFAVDSLCPHGNMMSVETGVSDTMHDLIVDTLGLSSWPRWVMRT